MLLIMLIFVYGSKKPGGTQQGRGNMAYAELEARLQLHEGRVSELLGIDEGSRYRRISTHRSTRIFLEPCHELREVQRQLHDLITERFEPHPLAHAYARKKSIITNARQHVGKKLLLHLDLVNFFGSIKKDRVARSLRQLLPWLMTKDAEALARLCCHSGHLPQGAPSSPILSNLICQPFDEQLDEMARSFNCVVTRYSDDICFSMNDELPIELARAWGHGVSQRVELGGALLSVIKGHGFAINYRKVRVQTQVDRQQVTGLIVNERLNVPSEFRERIRDALYRWARYGLTVAASIYHPQMSVEGFMNSLSGRIAYVGQVAGQSDRHYQRFKMNFEALAAQAGG